MVTGPPEPDSTIDPDEPVTDDATELIPDAAEPLHAAHRINT